MPYSYSRVSTHNDCAYKYKLRYIDKLEPLPDLRPNNALFEGTAIHTGIETRSIDKAIESYKSNYPELTEAHELEILKLKTILPEAIKVIPEGEYEYKLLGSDGFIGFIDLLVKVDEGVYDLYDFKYSNNVSKYKKSGQVHLYKYLYEKLTCHKVRNLYYVMVPKVQEVLSESITRQKLEDKILNSNKEIKFEKIEYDPQQISFFYARKALMDRSDKSGIYEKRYTTMCKFCEYQKYCSSNGKDTSELVQKNKKVEEVNLF